MSKHINKLLTLILLAMLMMVAYAPIALAQTDIEAPATDIDTTTEAGDADDPDDTTDDGGTKSDEDSDGPTESVFNNPAQAAKAESLAEAVAEESSKAVADAEQAETNAQAAVSDAQEAVNEAQAALEAATTPEETAKAEADLAAAQANLSAAEADLATAEQDVADAIANAASIDVSEIESMRAEGMGWGEIAKEIGVHPSALGLGHKKNETKVAKNSGSKGKPTERDITSEEGIGKENNGNSKSSLGKSRSSKSAGKGNSGGNGKGKGKGNNK